jgi:deoxyribodipyrimidine photo-lyase
MDTAVVLFTRDLRVHDHPGLAAAAREARRVIPLFVLDPAILRSPFGASLNRRGFLAESLADLDGALRRLGSHLVVRRGDPLRAVAELEPDAVYVADDASGQAQARERRLAERFELHRHPATTVVPLDDLKTYRVFTPYFRAWLDVPRRALESAPRLRDPGVASERLPVVPGGRSPEVARGGETAGRKLLEAWLPGVGRYAGNDLAGDTSRLSPYLHFGCVSALECVVRGAAGAAWVRQICWRDFYAQLLRAFPETSRDDLYDRPYASGEAGPAFDAWCEGRTGYPLVDAGMRQLRREGWMHNRARLVVASFLVKDLGVDWRHGAAHFERLLLDGDVASNRGNWQWVAGTGVDHTQGGRMFNPTLQAKRHDPAGAYIRRYVRELADLDTSQIHEPWRAGGVAGYPAPIVDHADVASRRRAGEQPSLF